MKDIPAIVAALTAPDAKPAVLATLVSVQGSSYRRPGARLLLCADGTRIGSISGGCLEEDVIARATNVRSTRRPDAVVYDTTSENDLVWGVGLGCHGVVRVLLEHVSPQPAWARALASNFKARRATALTVVHGAADVPLWGTRLAAPGDCPDAERLFLEEIPPPLSLAIFGAGDDAQPLVRLAKELGCHVIVADPRPAFATAIRFPSADAVVVAPAEQLADAVPLDAATCAVVMTHHYVHDVPLLRALIARPLGYLGLLGPRKRAEKILGDLAASGVRVTPEQRARLRAPVGLDLGADAPEQVALSILAEIFAVRTQRGGRPLKERTLPIHA